MYLYLSFVLFKIKEYVMKGCAWFFGFCCFIWLCFLLPWWLILCFVIIVGFIVVAINENTKEELKEERQRKRLAAQKRKEKKIIQKQEYEELKNKLIKRYGTPTNCILIEEDNLNKELIIFEESQYVWLFEKALPFSAILSCRVTDNVEVDEGDIEIDSTVDSDDMLGRAIVGGTVFGDTGAIVGGLTAKENHRIYRYSDEVYHNYKVHITIDDLSTPLIVVDLDDDEETASLIMSSMKVIIERNKRGNS